jgi:putative PIN family toxin of toxin-antitoxin system
MLKVVIDTTVMVSAFLKRVDGGATNELLRFGKQGAFEHWISDEIIEELAEVLLRQGRNRRRYQYPDSAVVEFCQGLARFAAFVRDVPEVHGIVRDPDDDKIIACAVAAGADYLVTRDKDLLALREYEGIAIISPEVFLHVLRMQT